MLGAAVTASIVSCCLAAMSEQIKVPGLETYKFAYEITGSELNVQLDVDTEGWVAFGISLGSGMRGADIVTIDGEGTIKDRYALGKFEPKEDCKQDWSLVSRTVQNGKTTIMIKRNLDTGDIQDHPIIDNGNPTPMIFAHANNDAKMFSYHGINKATMGVNFFGETVSVDQFYADTDVKQIEIKSHAKGKPAEMFEVPFPGNMDDVTNIINFCVDIPEELQKDGGHLIAFEQYVTPGNEALVHHYVLYGLDRSCAEVGGDVFERQPADTPILWAWQKGTGNMIFRSDMGFPVGNGTKVKALFNNVHYDNPRKQVGEKDGSGIIIHYTKKMRKYHMAVMNIGDPNVVLGGQALMDDRAPGADKVLHMFDCPASHFEQSDFGGKNTLYIMTSLQHMHRAGDYIKTEFVDIMGRTKKSWVHQLYDGNFQGSYNFEDLKYEKGDKVKVTCIFDNKLKAANKDILRWGLQGDEEMCMDFWYVYSPDINVAEIAMDNEKCGFSLTPGAKHFKRPVFDATREMGIRFAAPVNDTCESELDAVMPKYKMYTVGATEMSVGQIGADDAEHTVVALHGFPQASAMWWPIFAPRLAAHLGGIDKVRVVAPDMRGVNRTLPKYECEELGCENYKPSNIASEVALLLKTHFTAKSQSKVHLVGHDWGAAIAWYVAVFHKELIATLTVADFAHPAVFAQWFTYNPQQRAASNSYVPMLKDTDNAYPQFDPTKFPGNPMLKGVIDVADEQEADYMAWSYKDTLKYHMYWYRGSSGFQDFGSDFVGNASIIGPEIPVVQLWGEHDTSVLASAICCLKSVVSKLRVKVFGGASHWLIDEFGDDVANYVAMQIKGDIKDYEFDKCEQAGQFCTQELHGQCMAGGALPVSTCDTSQYPENPWPLTCMRMSDDMVKAGAVAPADGKFYSDDKTMDGLAVSKGAQAPVPGVFCPEQKQNGAGKGEEPQGGCDICGGFEVDRDKIYQDPSSGLDTSCADVYEYCLQPGLCGAPADCPGVQAFFKGQSCCTDKRATASCNPCGTGRSVKKGATFTNEDAGGAQSSCEDTYNFCLVNAACTEGAGGCNNLQYWFTNIAGCCDESDDGGNSNNKGEEESTMSTTSITSTASVLEEGSSDSITSIEATGSSTGQDSVTSTASVLDKGNSDSTTVSDAETSGTGPASVTFTALVLAAALVFSLSV